MHADRQKLSYPGQSLAVLKVHDLSTLLFGLVPGVGFIPTQHNGNLLLSTLLQKKPTFELLEKTIF